MSEPFLKRSSYSNSTFINREGFEYLLSRLSQLGFTDYLVILPQFIINSDKKLIAGPEKKVLQAKDFLDYDQDFKGIILQARNEKKEEIVILFKNDTKNKITFDNNIFGVVDKNPKSNLYISTDDPVRTYGLTSYLQDFFKDRVKNPGLRTFILALVIISGLAWAYLISIPQSKIWVLIATTIALVGWISVLINFLPPTGVQISTVRKTPYPQYIEELKKNWLTIVITVLLSGAAGLLGTYISKVLGWQS